METHEDPERSAEKGAAWRPVVPLLLVNAVAVAGQIAYGLGAYAPDGWIWPARVAVALAAAAAAESVALYVNWHAHDALLQGYSATAARMRRAAYLIAGVVAAINYSHFAAGWAPTPAAVLFGGCSLLSPWLWGLHTRRAQRLQLHREGKRDSAGAIFSAERLRWFPIRTLAARRWSIDHGVTDPAAAWAGYNAAGATRRAARAASRTVPEGTGAPPGPVPADSTESGGETPTPVRPRGRTRRAPASTAAPPTDTEALAMARKHVAENGPVTGLNDFKRAAGLNGYSRASRLWKDFQAEQADFGSLRSVSGGAR